MLSWLLGCLCRCVPGRRREADEAAEPAGPAARAGSLGDGEGLEGLRQVPGVGPKTVQRLEEAGYGSLDDLRAATQSALERVPGVSRRAARAIKQALA